MRNTRYCPNPNCSSKADDKGGFSRVGFKTDSKKDPYFCPHCKTELTAYVADPNPTTPAPAAADAKKNGGKKMKKEKKVITETNLMVIMATIFGGIILLVLIIILIWGGSLFIMDHIRGGNNTNLDGAAATTDVTDTTSVTDTTAADKTNSNDYQVGEPADAKDINNDVWNQPYSDAVMVGIDGTTSVYTQSGKDGSTTLSGTIPAGWALVVDSLDLNVNGESFVDGNLLVIINDSKTDKDISGYKISYFNGGAQLIPVPGLQNLLDNNIALKFARGDWNKDTNKWSYSPWALANLWIPEGYVYNPLKLTYESDTYPNRDLATDTDSNTSGAVNK